MATADMLDRWSFAKMVYLHRARVTVAALATIVGALAWVRDDLVLSSAPSNVQGQWKMKELTQWAAGYVPLPFWVWAALVFICVVGSMFELSYRHSRKLTRKINDLEALQEPRLEIVVEGNGRPFVQEREFKSEGASYRQRHVRVGIRNPSMLKLHDVRLVLESISPGEQLIFPEHMLQVMDIPKRSGIVDVSPGEMPTAFFDVASEIFTDGAGQAQFYISYANVSLIESSPIPASVIPYLFTVRADCEGGASRRATFLVTKLNASSLLEISRR